MNKRSIVTSLRWMCAGAAVLLSGCHMEVLSPKGDIGMDERSLIFIALGLMSLVVIPVIVLTLVFAWKYRASNTKATYAPKWSHSTAIEAAMSLNHPLLHNHSSMRERKINWRHQW